MRGKPGLPAAARKQLGLSPSSSSPSPSSSMDKRAKKGAWQWRAAALAPLLLAACVAYLGRGSASTSAAAAAASAAAYAAAAAGFTPEELGESAFGIGEIAAGAPTTTESMRARVVLGDADTRTPHGRFNYSMRSPFYSVEQFPAFQVLQDHWEEIRDEALGITPVLALRRRQDEWGEGAARFAERLIAAGNKGWVVSWDGGGGWLNYALAYFGNIVPGVTELWAPKTTELLRRYIPGIRIGGFSRLLPNAYIAPHTDTTGLAYHSMAFHLCLSGRATLRLGNDWVEQVPGKILIFDTTLEHEVLNGPDDRIVLYMDFDIDLFLRGTEGYDPAAAMPSDLA